MKEILVLEYQLAQLNYDLGRALGMKHVCLSFNKTRCYTHPFHKYTGGYFHAMAFWSPATNWEQAGPILEHFRSVVFSYDDDIDVVGCAVAQLVTSAYEEGPTHLVALARAALKYMRGEYDE